MTAEKPRILVVEDDSHVQLGLVAGLTRAGFEVSVASDGEEAVRAALGGRFDLVVLDLMLPKQSGFDVLEAVRGRLSTPVIVLSARTELDARLRSFAGGAVDYLAKPFFIEELLVRVRARLLLRDDGPRRVLAVGRASVDLDARTVTRDGVDLGLTSYEFNVVAWLAERPGRAVSREQLAEHVLGEGERVDRTIDSHLSRARKKLGEDGALFKTVWGIGYRFDPELT